MVNMATLYQEGAISPFAESMEISGDEMPKVKLPHMSIDAVHYLDLALEYGKEQGNRNLESFEQAHTVFVKTQNSIDVYEVTKNRTADFVSMETKMVTKDVVEEGLQYATKVVVFNEKGQLVGSNFILK